MKLLNSWNFIQVRSYPRMGQMWAVSGMWLWYPYFVTLLVAQGTKDEYR